MTFRTIRKYRIKVPRYILARRKKTMPKLRIFKSVWHVFISFTLALWGLVLPFSLNPDQFHNIESYWYVFSGFLIAGFYMTSANIFFLHARFSDKFRNRADARQRLTINLRRARRIAVGGGVALLATAIALVPADSFGIFATWALITTLLHLFGYLLSDDTFSPADIKPISEKEMLDATIAYQQMCKEGCFDADGGKGRSTAQ